MSTLTSAPYNYAFDDLVYVRISAINTYGSSTISMTNSDGARIRQKPSLMGTPTMLSRTKTSITVQWTALTGAQTGNSAILTYNLYWDGGSGVSTI